jgi:monoamine oxidase
MVRKMLTRAIVSHTSLFDRLRRTFRLASYCEGHDLSAEEGIALRAEAEEKHASSPNRREFLTALGAIAATGAIGGLSAACAAPGASEDGEGTSLGTNGQSLSHTGALDVAIVGAGLAGLACADQLRINGVTATVYEGNNRVGGRQLSQAGTFPGQVVELGGELIDTSQKNMINYARAFGLTLEDYLKSPGAVFYNIDGQAVPEATVVDAYRAFVPSMRPDLQQLSAAPTADTHNAFDVVIDNTSIAQYLDSRNAPALLKSVIAAAYVGEYGREVTDQSALNFLLYIRADRRSRFQPFGTSDQRFHIVEGNDRIAKGLAARLSGQIQLGMALSRARKTASGQIELTFRNGQVRTHDLVVFAMPFSVLRQINLDASLALPAWKTKAINELGYGMNSKNMVGFDARIWADQGSNGMAYATLPNVQNCWETSWTTATASHSVMTNFTGGALGMSQDPSQVQAQTAAFLGDLDKIYPGSAGTATRDSTSGNYRAVMMSWPRNPWAQASYTCYRPGQFTGIAGNEGKPVGNVYFAGEHCDSFYNQQGFMEGALSSGLITSAAILAAARKAA